MSTIKAIEGRSVHQIQSGQVIVDLNSVVKELVENSLDAGATSIEIRFKNHGLDSVEVQDNGAGILADDYETIALKHYTSKLSSYEDLSSLDTFGFRGEALSSLCALSHFHIVTARESEAPKGKRLDFETSGKLKSTTVAACPRGTTVAVENLFYNLPVRRRELEKNIKREYGKVLTLLHAYACISTGVRCSVSNQMSKGKKVIVFSTNSNPSTKQNISNVFGAKTLSALIPMDLKLELQPTTARIHKDTSTQADASAHQVHLVGHVSRPVFGEGRQTPDRQMFFVNARPCNLPQISKAFNEVYKSYNITQSPFIFANLKMNTNAYDVNVSPDKLTILLHDQNALLESLKESLNKLFEAQDQTVPQSHLPGNHLPLIRSLTASRSDNSNGEDHTDTDGPSQVFSAAAPAPYSHVDASDASSIPSLNDQPTSLLQNFERNSKDRKFNALTVQRDKASPKRDVTLDVVPSDREIHETSHSQADASHVEITPEKEEPAQEFKDRLANQEAMSNKGHIETTTNTSASAASISGLVPSAFDRMRSSRQMEDSPKPSTFEFATRPAKRQRTGSSPSTARSSLARPQFSRFAKRIHVYAAPGTQRDDASERSNEESDIEEGAEEDGESMKPVQSNLSGSQGSDAESDTLRETRGNGSDGDSDGDFIDETERRRRDEARTEEMVRRAEAVASRPTEEQKQRAVAILKSGVHKESTLSLVSTLETSVEEIENQLAELSTAMTTVIEEQKQNEKSHIPTPSKASAEERLSLTIAKSDFAQMRIIGQFNLGFILATRPSNGKTTGDDLFIIDQHASDEIYNFSRLSATTTLNPQPLVRPHQLELTAIEEETIINHTATLVKNGFTIAVDESGASPVGQRCQLLTLPTSRETVFDTRDLEELIALLGDAAAPSSSSSAHVASNGGAVTRPSKVRKMLAMRACRSSIMVGKPLTNTGMARVVRHMGEIDRPWNCPHGRPTMRHLAGLGEWGAWDEGDGLADDDDGGAGRDETDWWVYLREAKQEGGALHAGKAKRRRKKRDLRQQADGAEVGQHDEAEDYDHDDDGQDNEREEEEDDQDSGLDDGEDDSDGAKSLDDMDDAPVDDASV